MANTHLDDERPVVRLVDDDPTLLRSLRLLLVAAGFRTRTYDDPSAFLASCGDEPGCVVLDLQMPGPSGLDVQEALTRAGKPLPVIFLTGHGDVRASVRAMKGGAADFLVKPVTGEEFVSAVRRAIDLDAAARRERQEHDRLRARFDTLTPRERQVFELIVRGLLNKEAAAMLGTSERTIKAHRANIMRKMSVTSVASLARIAERLQGAERGSAPD